MKIIDLNRDYEKLYFVCLEDWSPEMKEAGNHKEVWYSRMKGQGPACETGYRRPKPGRWHD